MKSKRDIMLKDLKKHLTFKDRVRYVLRDIIIGFLKS